MSKYIEEKDSVEEVVENTVTIRDKRIMEIIRIVSSNEHILKWVYDFASGFTKN